MNAYPPELATPPLALVALLGCPELHAGVGEFLRSQQRPPINSLGVADPWAAPRLFGERKSTLTAPADQTGILKANWFAKHRQKRPAVAVLFLERDAVTGNPSDWAVACSALEAVKSAAKGRGARVAVVVVGSCAAELPEERSGAIARIGGIDKKALVLLERGPDEAGLRRLGRLLHETAGQAYLDAARRRLSLHAERRIQSPELSARVAFKAAALAEFRADWATAVKTYQNAYAEVARVGLGPPLPLQRAFEVAAVAEHIHVKVVTLLLHQQRLGEALQQFRQHLGLFRRPPFALPPAAAAAHAGWVSRQHLAMGELLDTRADASQLPPQRDARPAHFFLCAAQAAVQRRRWAARGAEARGGRPPRLLSPAPAPGPYVGQVAVRDPPRRLTDEEFVQHLEAQEAALDHASLALEVLAQAQEHCSKAAGGRGSRQAYYIGLLIAREHLASGDASTAHRLLLLVAGIYRREQWRLPLSAALLELLECETRLSLKQEHVLHSLELSALDGSMAPPQRAELASAALASLAAGESGEEGGKGGIELAVKPVNHPLLSCFQLSAGFAEPDAAAKSQPGGGRRFGVALRSLLPVDVPVAGVEASFAAAGGGETAVALAGGGGCLRPGEWARWTGEVAAPPGAVLTARDVVLRVSDCACVRWHLPAFPGFPLLGGSGGEADAALLARAGLAIVPGLHEAQAPPDFQPVELRLEGESFGLVGETGLVRLALRAPCAVGGASLRLQAGFLEGGSHPRLSLTDAHGVRHEGQEAGPDAVDGVPTVAACVLERVSLGRLEAGVEQQLEMAVTFPRSGQLLLSASLAHNAPQADAAPGSASAELEVTVEEPFSLTAQLLTLPMTSALLLPEPPNEAATQRDEAGEPQPEALPSEEVCLLRASLRVSAPTEVEVASVSVRGPDGLEWLDASAAGVGPATPAALGKADILSCVLRFRSAAAGSRPSLGQLLVSWKRRRKGSVAPGCVETAVPLPGARFVTAPLTVRLSLPGAATAGQPLQLRLALRNRTPLLQRFTVAVGDASGFVLAGGRSAAGSVLPHATAEHALTLVGYSPGLLALPQVRLTALRYGAVVEPLAGHRLLVCPAAVGPAAPEQASAARPAPVASS